MTPNFPHVPFEELSLTFERQQASSSRFKLNDYAYIDLKGQKQVRAVFEQRPAVAILVYNEDNKTVVLVRQVRVPVALEHGSADIWELPAGVVDHDEYSFSAAARELREETGYDVQLGRLYFVGETFPSPGACNEKIELYFVVVTNADKTATGGGLEEEGEYIHIEEVPVSEAVQAAVQGMVHDMKTMMALLWLGRRLGI